MTKIVTMYNNKGGVSKTTTLFNLAVYLSQQGKKILLSDCDPQCNLTEVFFASREELNNPNKPLPGTSIYEALLPRFKGETNNIKAKNVKLIESTVYPNLYLFRGDIEFSLAETYLGTAWNQAVTENIHEKNTYVAIYKLLQSLGTEHQFDYILCDVGPSTGSITRMIVLACDGIFLPLVPDRFCNQAVKLLGKVVHEWSLKHEQIMLTLKPFGIEGFPGKPKLLGAIVQNFKVHSRAKAKQSYKKWQDRISKDIKQYLIGKEGITTGSNFNSANPYVATIRELGPLAPIAQMFGRAMFDIRQEDTEAASTTGSMYYGSVWQLWKDRMKEYKEEIAKIAKYLP